jgi:hypothetical protein
MTSHLDPTNGKNSRHRIWLHQWVCSGSYWIEFYDQHAGAEQAKMLASGYVLANRGDWIVPAEGPIAPPNFRSAPPAEDVVSGANPHGAKTVPLSKNNRGKR